MAEPPENKGAVVRFIKRDDAPDIFIDGLEGMSVVNGAIRLTLFRMRGLPSTEENYDREVFAYLVMSMTTAQVVARDLHNFVKRLERSGMAAPLPEAAPSPPPDDVDDDAPTS